MALIGAGASATFTDDVHADQSIRAGELEVSVRGPSGSSSDGKTVTLARVGPVGSTFTTGPQRVFAMNSGTVSAHAVRLRASTTGGPRSLPAEIYVKIVKWSGTNGTGTDTEVYNGTLTNLEANPLSINGPVFVPSDWDQFDVTFYAGSDGAPSLSNVSQGGVVVPTITVDFEG
jgi:predicted ribosomally synthesized peptide with SipW-like signal peptide